MAEHKYNREICVALLQSKQAQLSAEGEKRYPARSDFTGEEVVAIKAFLGPWPRALEAAALKPPRNGDRLLLNREKRIRSKRARNKLHSALEENKNLK